MGLKISVITVTFNSEKFIEDCIKSVLDQEYNNVEYIVVDGASTDSTMSIINRYRDKINIIISEPDKGIYDAINKGIKLATGEVIGILNSDDFFADNRVLKNVVHEFQVDKALEAVYADVAFVDRESGEKILRYYSSKLFKPWMFRFGFQPAHPTFYVKRTTFKSLGLYRADMKIAGDFELLARFLAKNDIKYKYLNSLLVKMRIGGISSSGLKSVFLLNSEIIAALKANNIYTNKPIIYSKYLVKWWGYIFK